MQPSWKFKQGGLVLMLAGGGVFLMGTFLWTQYSLPIPYAAGIVGWIAASIGAVLYVYGLLRAIFRK